MSDDDILNPVLHAALIFLLFVGAIIVLARNFGRFWALFTFLPNFHAKAIQGIGTLLLLIAWALESGLISPALRALTKVEQVAEKTGSDVVRFYNSPTFRHGGASLRTNPTEHLSESLSWFRRQKNRTQTDSKPVFFANLVLSTEAVTNAREWLWPVQLNDTDRIFHILTDLADLEFLVKKDMIRRFGEPYTRPDGGRSMLFRQVSGVDVVAVSSYERRLGEYIHVTLRDLDTRIEDTKFWQICLFVLGSAIVVFAYFREAWAARRAAAPLRKNELPDSIP